MKTEQLDSRTPKEPKEGQYIEIDDGAVYQLYECTDWDRAQFRVQTQLYPIAVNIKITGRTVQFGSRGPRVRCKVEWVGDCELSAYSGGWLHLIPQPLYRKLYRKL